MAADEPTLRVATPADAGAIDVLMKASAAALFPGSYTAAQVASAVRFVAEVDPMLLADGTYFVVEADGGLVACGGWSRRDKQYAGGTPSADDDRLLDPATDPARVRAMFTHPDWTRRGLGRRILDECEAAARREGFGRMVLGATLSGLPFYLAYGFRELERVEVRTPDGTVLEAVMMEMEIRPER